MVRRHTLWIAFETQVIYALYKLQYIYRTINTFLDNIRCHNAQLTGLDMIQIMAFGQYLEKSTINKLFSVTFSRFAAKWEALSWSNVVGKKLFKSALIKYSKNLLCTCLSKVLNNRCIGIKQVITGHTWKKWMNW